MNLNQPEQENTSENSPEASSNEELDERLPPKKDFKSEIISKKDMLDAGGLNVTGNEVEDVNIGKDSLITSSLPHFLEHVVHHFKVTTKDKNFKVEELKDANLQLYEDKGRCSSSEEVLCKARRRSE